MLLILSIYIYYKLFLITRLSSQRNTKILLGFYIQTSLSIPLFVIEILNSIVVVVDYYNPNDLTAEQSCSIIITVYFILAVLFL